MKKQMAAVLAAMFAMSSATVMAAPITDLVDKTTFSGDLRVRYDIKSVDGANDDDIMKYRLRLNIANKLSDNVTLAVRFTNGENEFGENDGKFFLDQYNLTYKIPNYTFKVGRQDIKLFECLAAHTTAWAGESTENKEYAMFEGLMATTKFGHVDATAFFGEMSNRVEADKFDTQGLVLGTKLDSVNMGVAFVEVSDPGAPSDNFDHNFVSITANTTVDKMYYGLEFVNGLDLADQDTAWMAVAYYGKLKNVGDVCYKLEYRDVERGALVKNLTDRWKSSSQDYKMWSIEANKQLAKDVTGKLYYENFDFTAGTKKDENTIRGELVVKF